MIRFVITLFVSDVRVMQELPSVRSDYEDLGDIHVASASVKRKKDLTDHDRAYIHLLRQLLMHISKPVATETERVYIGKRKGKTYATELDRTPNDFASIGTQRA